MAFLFDNQANLLHELMDLKHTIVYGVEGTTTITLKGCCQLLVLYGKISCLGFTFTAVSPKVFTKLPSPESHSHLTLITEEDSLNEIDVERLQLSASELEVLTDVVSTTSCTVIFAVKSDYCKISRYLRKFYKNLFSAHELKTEDTRKYSYQLSTDENFSQKQIILPNDWQTAACQIFEKPEVLPVIAICGGSNVGKSTLSKFLINNYINSNRNENIWYVECDPGQSEFVYPGCVSLKLIKKPVFGPAFMNLSSTTKSYFVGGVSMAANPDLYVTALEEIFITLTENLKKGGKYPVIINTMGWSKGLGINLLVDLIRIFHPTHIVQIHSDSSRDIVDDITPSFLKTASGWRYIPGELSECKFEFIKIPSAVSLECMTSSLFTSSVKRSLVILAYLAKMQDNVEFKPINHFTPFRVGFSKIFVKICHEDVRDEYLASSLTGSLVALCSLPNKKIAGSVIEKSANGLSVIRNTIACECLGLGIIRCIDEKSQHFYVISPLSLSQLSHVNVFMMGSITIPNELLLTQVCEGPVMYAINRKKSVTDKLLPTSLLRRRPRS